MKRTEIEWNFLNKQMKQKINITFTFYMVIRFPLAFKRKDE
jgi:hypothetical protein